MRGDRFSFRFCWHQCLAFSWLRSQQQVWRRAFPIIIPDGVGKAKRKRRSGWAQSRRVTALLLWIIHSHSDRTWMAWLQLLTCAITLTLSITLSPSLTLSQTRVHRKNPDTHTHTPYAFHSGQFHVVYVKADGVWSLQSTAGLLYCGNDLWSQ